MKRFIGILVLLVTVVVSVFGGNGFAVGLLIAAPPVVLDTQQIVFLRSLKEEYEAIDTWLKEAEDLSSFVEDGQTLVFPEGGAAPTVYKNRTTDIDSVEPTETVHKEALDVYDSQNYKLRNIYMHALSFNKIQFYTKKSSDSIVKQEIEDAAHAFAPEAAGRKIVIIPTTGAVKNGLKMMTLEDVIALAGACDSAEFPESGRNLVLPSDMWWDLVNNNTILKGQLERQKLDGIIMPIVVEYYGIRIHKSVQKLNVGWDLVQSIKAPQGTVITGDIVPAGFLFVKEATFFAGGAFEMFRQVKSQNTGGRAEEFGFQHRFKAGNQFEGKKYSALVYQDKQA